MAQSISRQLFEGVFRVKNFSGEIYFEDLLRQVIPLVLGINGIALDEYIEKKENRLWNYFNKAQKAIIQQRSCSPAFTVISNQYKRINFLHYPTITNFKKSLIKSRPNILDSIDKINARQYEALACLALKCLGAQKYLLTPPGNEAGIDFIGSIDFGVNAHYLFGVNGPVRIIGQCKKYASECQVNTIKEFNATLTDVYSLTDKVKKVIPHWFRSGKGPIIGWIVSHSGFQIGAIDRAKNYGILISDSKSIAELISASRKFHPNLSPNNRANKIVIDCDAILEEFK